ncbi:MAG: hypothetical protein ACK53Y_24160, partial [bacterium]
VLATMCWLVSLPVLSWMWCLLLDVYEYIFYLYLSRVFLWLWLHNNHYTLVALYVVCLLLSRF